MEPINILIQLKKIKPDLASRFGVKKIGVFGSFVKGNVKETSDIDIYVEFEQKSFRKIVGLIDYLEKFFQRKVDLLYPHKNANPVVMDEISKEIVYV